MMGESGGKRAETKSYIQQFRYDVSLLFKSERNEDHYFSGILSYSINILDKCNQQQL